MEKQTNYLGVDAILSERHFINKEEIQLLISLDGINFYINSPFLRVVLLILIALIGFVLLMLYNRFSHFGKKVHFPSYSLGEGDKPGPSEWEKQMLNLAESHSQVKLTGYSFVLNDYNQVAYKKLNKIRDRISVLSTDIISLIPAARWLFDNFQMMYREIKKVRTSGTSYAVLPVLKGKEYRNFPRIYVVAKRIVALSGGHLSEENISVMLTAYQQKIPLTDKEIWVLPEVLGFCLLEEIIVIADEILSVIDVKSKAEKFLREKLEGKQSTADISVLFCEIEDNLRLNYSFHAHVIYLLKNMSFDEASIQRYLEYHFASLGRQVRTSEIFLEEGKMEAFLEANIRTLIVSLRDINEVDEEKFFEEYSCLEQILSQDPDGVYSKMDLEARGMYRGVIVKLSLRYRLMEEKIAKDCLELAIQGREDLHCSHHVGAYLLGKGYPILKAKTLGKPIPQSIKKKRNVKGFFYFLSLFLIILGLSACLLYAFWALGGLTAANRHVITLLVVMPLLIGISIEITNYIFTRRIRVKKIPSLDYQKEIPEEARTFVVMPVIVSSKEQGLQYMERLQKHYLANRQPNLYFALLLDFEDSPSQSMPKDEVIQSALAARMKELNELYPSEHQRFSLFFRCRKWNEAENCYMGWERKRGKLEEFNSLLNGAGKESTTFSSIYCDEELFTTFQYVITLDADTNLLRDNAAKLVGLIDHPLNKPILDSTGGKVKEGYVIIQPSVRNHIVDKHGSRFTKIFGGESGLDHYGTVISDIYQDIFGEGIYTGKGIYDRKAFHKLLHNKVPENRILSHDLFESCYARTAFSSAAKIMDSFPNSVLSFTKREHRWLRGDWQLLPWLFMKKTPDGGSLSPLSKWKIFDNLRRSLVPLSKTLFILLNLAWMPGAYYLWIPFVFFSDIFNLIILLIAVITQKLIRPNLALIYKGFLKELAAMVERTFLEFTITPYRAYVASDAIARTLYRIFISKRNLLRWNTAEAVDASIINTRKGYFLTMWSNFLPAFVLLVIIFMGHLNPAGIILAAIIIADWSIAFEIAYRISQPEKKYLMDKAQDSEMLICTARRTWLFFKELSTKENNWLCPDNYQIGAVTKVSDKTSPTNIGLQFLAILSARDFGFETLSSTVEAVENLLETVHKMQKWKGHLYNWYHIETLEVLDPAYISTVDSGNFFGHLVALKNGLLEQVDKPLYPDNILSELEALVKDSNEEIQQRTGNSAGNELRLKYTRIGELIEDIADIWENLNERELSPPADYRYTRQLMSTIDSIVNETSALKLKEESFSSYPTLRCIAAEDNKFANNMINRIRALSNKIDCLLTNVDFRFLFNDKRMLFHIGYHVSSHMLDDGCYDLMASESALTSLLAIAKGEVPLKHWYKLGRPLTIVGGVPCFVSWSGTMFEYLMPNLVFKEYEGSVYAQTSRAAVLQHMKYAKEAEIPWGISESQYYRFDLNSNYQYKAFGVPKIRLQPVHRNSLVVAPYATMLALDIAEEECVENLKRMKELGAFGDYGFYEAIDFNVPNSVELTPYCIVKSYMAHHQGMNLAAINNYLNEGILRERFHAEMMIKATEVLLEEKRRSHLISIAKQGYTIKIGKPLFKEVIYSNRYVGSVAVNPTVANYLSNGKYSLMITTDGDGFSKYEDRMLYRWRSDIYANTGNYIYVKDMKQGKVWSTTYHPTRTEPEDYQVVFWPHKAEFKRRDGDISTHMIVSLDADHNFEIRKVTFTNHGNEEKQLEVTSYLEVVDDTHPAELSHPAFNKLFLESEYLEEDEIFLAKRRRKKEEDNPYLIHMVRTGAKLCKKVEYENDKKRFIGRNNTLENPDSVVNSITFFNNSGFCNDPIMSLRVRCCIEPGETACISFITGVCGSKEEAIKIAGEFNVSYRIDDILEKFRLQKNLELKYLEITKLQLNAFQDLISPIFYSAGIYRGPVENIRRNFKNQSFLWKFGISGDNPILLLKVASMEDGRLVKDVLKAYEYLRINRVMVDLVILIDSKHGYFQEVDMLISDMTSSLRIYDSGSEKPSFFTLHTYEMIPAEIDLLYTVARVVFSEKTGIYFNHVKENMYELLED
ncbi:glucoamylase family protein [Anaerocolumna xylanovorans]|uniref:Putative glucoamylase n=1 Tax=Anaerocolumna xylanovorans DSM 12503 TaxID=1121345 RepID=A0A1M7YIA5_9FIRM|nr:glucoamylase family protein [Anaerocolumna xylanovorans]SHO52374.1 Putative glucoamylase [Anaerocolumna xylanovorans DSM 12503]